MTCVSIFSQKCKISKNINIGDRSARTKQLRAPSLAVFETSDLSRFYDAFVGVRVILKLRGKAMSFPIVGIGASAGGLQSISELLAGIPSPFGVHWPVPS
jgi:chemotaxis response regulator CheB